MWIFLNIQTGNLVIVYNVFRGKTNKMCVIGQLTLHTQTSMYLMGILYDRQTSSTAQQLKEGKSLIVSS